MLNYAWCDLQVNEYVDDKDFAELMSTNMEGKNVDDLVLEYMNYKDFKHIVQENIHDEDFNNMIKQYLKDDNFIQNSELRTTDIPMDTTATTGMKYISHKRQ